ncbi:MAG TPA: response regulator transcription factor [Acidimicrobiia bacterium]|nr:response regulator transcription factor [Acidimicrobiia bacterium]
MSDGFAERILIVEDEESLVESIRFTLESEGYDVVTAHDGVSGLEAARHDNPSLILLDLMLPKMSGIDVCRHIRQESDVPVVMLTAKDGEADKVLGLEMGADDYITKPFSSRELLARVRAHLRRAGRTGTLADANEVLRGGAIELDVDAHVVRLGGTEVPVRPKEFELLEVLMRRKNRLSSRELLIDEVWGPSYFGDTKTLDVHIKRLRDKLEKDPSNPVHIVTVRGLGYKFVD